MRRLGLIGIGLCAALACQAPPGGRLLALPPPPAWNDDLLRYRDARDRFMRQDPESPLLPDEQAAFDGLSYFAPDPAYYRVGPVSWYAEPERFSIVTTAGQWRECEKVGHVDFELHGHDLTLQVYRLLDAEPQSGGSAFFLPFMDATTGEETYPSGRYLDLAGPPGGPFVLDFNRAKNPSCAYGSPERFACPVTPAENRLPLRIEAGETGYRKAEGR